jgi:hypothetical protein
MTAPNSELSERNSISLRLGKWFEARGTGWGVLAVPLVVLLLALVAGSRLVQGWPG